MSTLQEATTVDHLEEALERAADEDVRCHIRSALQHLVAED